MGSSLSVFIFYTQVWVTEATYHIILNQIQLPLQQGWGILAVHNSQKVGGLPVNILHRDSVVYKLKISAC